MNNNFVVYDIGGTNIKYGVVNLNTNEITNKGHFPTKAKTLKGVEIINNIVEHFNANFANLEIDAIGVSAAGVIDNNLGKVIHANDHFIEYVNLEIANIITTKTNKKCFVENDVNCAALGELAINNLTSDNALVIALGTGIGGAVVINHKILPSNNLCSGEVGMLKINDANWEDLASPINFAKQVSKKYNQEIDIKDLYDDLEKYADDVATFYDLLAEGISRICWILDPKEIIIGGGVTDNQTFDIDALKSHIKQNIPSFMHEKLNVKKAKAGNSAALIGAAQNAKDRLNNE